MVTHATVKYPRSSLNPEPLHHRFTVALNHNELATFVIDFHPLVKRKDGTIGWMYWAGVGKKLDFTSPATTILINAVLRDAPSVFTRIVAPHVGHLPDEHDTCMEAFRACLVAAKRDLAELTMRVIPDTPVVVQSARRSSSARLPSPGKWYISPSNDIFHADYTSGFTFFSGRFTVSRHGMRDHAAVDPHPLIQLIEAEIRKPAAGQVSGLADAIKHNTHRLD